MLGYGLVGGPGVVVSAVATDVVYAAAVMLLAIGLARDSSVVARRPLGLIALGIVALWPLTDSLIAGLLAAVSPDDAAAWSIYGYVSLFIPIAAALIAAVQIARAGVVASPWRWAPLGVLALQAAVWAIPQIGFAALGPRSDVQAFAAPLSVLGMLGFLANTLGLGILAVVLASRESSDSVEVFRSARSSTLP